MTSELQVICPECKTLHPLGRAYCHDCGTSLDRAQLVQSLAEHPQQTEEPPGFFAWWFKPSVTVIFRWPLIVLYPILALVVLAWIVVLIVTAFPYEPVTISIGVLVTFPILLGPSYSFLMALGRTYAVWVSQTPEGEGVRILKSILYLILPFVVYTVVITLLGVGLEIITGLEYQP